MEPASDGAGVEVEDAGDGGVVGAVEFAQDQHGTERFGEAADGLADTVDGFVTLGLFDGGGVVAVGCGAFGEDLAFSSFPFEPAGGDVEGDTVEPGVEGALVLELMQPLEGADEGVLKHILGVGFVGQVVDEGGVEPVLVGADKFPERLGVTV